MRETSSTIRCISPRAAVAAFFALLPLASACSGVGDELSDVESSSSTSKRTRTTWYGPGGENMKEIPDRTMETPKLSVGPASATRKRKAGTEVKNKTILGKVGTASDSSTDRFVSISTEPSGEGLGSAKSGEASSGPSAGIGSLGRTKGATSSAEPEARAHGPEAASKPPPREAGRLTAGRWRDLDHWDYWTELFESTGPDASDESEQEGWSDEWREFEQTWGIYTRRRIPVRVHADGEPVVDAEVTLLNAEGETLWSHRTDRRGRAQLFDGLFDDASGDERRIRVEAGDHTRTIRDVEVRDEPRVVRLEAISTPTPETVDVMFTVDTTGSMSDELDYLEAELSSVVDRVRRQLGGDVPLRLSANFYRDTSDTYVVRSNAFTPSADRIVGQFAGASAGGGGDTPEAVGRALVESIREHEWSRDARARLLFLVLDAPPHRSQAAMQRVRRATRLAAERGVRIVPVVGSGIDKKSEFLMRSMAIATGGTYVFLTDDSGIGGSHLEPTIGPHDVHALNDLLVEITTEYATRSR